MIDIAVNNSDMENAEQFIKAFGKTAERAVSRALNRAVAGVKTDTVKASREEYNVKATRVRKSFKIKKAGNSVLEAAAVSSGSKIPLIHFGARPNKPRGRRPVAGATVQVKQQRKNIPHSFAATMGTGHTGLYRRKGKGRLPIEELYGPAVPHMVDNDNVLAEIKENAVGRFNKNLYHEVEFALQKMGAK